MKLVTSVLAGLITLVGIPAVHAQSSVVGQWGPLQTLPWDPVHSVMLPTGKVLLFPTDDAVNLWDPSSGALTSLAGFGFNPLCNGHSHLADGRVLMAGGHIANFVGLPNTSIFNADTGKFKTQATMFAGRWYPTLVTLKSGDVVALSGDIQVGVSNDIPDVFEMATGTWRRLTDAQLDLPLYPASFAAPDGRVFVATNSSYFLDTAGTGSWSTSAVQQASGRDNYGSACMYDDGLVLYTGGGNPPLASCERIDLNVPTPEWSYVAPMPKKRRQQNATLLPDGTVLVTGGSSSSGFDTNDGPKPAIRWDPSTNQWETWATEDEYRGNHSGAVLLPDGRVASIGGDTTATLQVFSPPYLFQGPRPTVTSAPGTVCYGQTFFVATPDAAGIDQVNWIRPAAVTHTKNMNQRINRLAFTPAPGGLNVTAPSQPELCPPGDHMMFLVDTSGVPSVAVWLRLPGDTAVPYCTAGTSFSGCKAILSGSGAASATATSGFDLTASVLEGSKDGLFFFGTNGRQANPWGSGTSYQCVVPPVVRGGLLTGAGTAGFCDGSFVQDLNALWCSTCPRPAKNPGPGVVVQAQLWYRDPQNTSNQTTSLSNAIEFCVAP